MSYIKRIFGQNLRKYRKNKWLSQERLAELTGLKLIGISQIERGLKFASAKTLQNLCTAFRCEPKDLFGFDVKRILTKEEKTNLADIKNILENHPEHIKDTLNFVIGKI